MHPTMIKISGHHDPGREPFWSLSASGVAEVDFDRLDFRVVDLDRVEPFDDDFLDDFLAVDLAVDLADLPVALSAVDSAGAVPGVSNR